MKNLISTIARALVDDPDQVVPPQFDHSAGTNADD